MSSKIHICVYLKDIHKLEDNFCYLHPKGKNDNKKLALKILLLALECCRPASIWRSHRITNFHMKVKRILLGISSFILHTLPLL